MPHHAYSGAAAGLFIACRYVVYVCLALFTAAAWHEHWHGLWLLVALPLLLHLACRVVVPPRELYALHLAEALAANLVLHVCGAPVEVLLLAVWIFTAGNVALWGWRILGWGVVISLLGWLVVTLPGVAEHAASASRASPLLGISCLVAATAFSLMLSAAAHHQAQLLSLYGLNWRAESRALRRFLPDMPGNPPRRVWASVGFIDLRGFTAATAELTDDALSHLLNEFFAGVTELVHRWDGHVAKFLGDGVLCVFPAQSAAWKGNSAVQALRCLRQMPAMLAGLPQVQAELPVSMGLASGECLTGIWGGAGRFDHTVIGTAVNRAARLQSHATSYGGLLMDAETAVLVASSEPIGIPVTLELKGLGRVQARALMVSNGMDVPAPI